MLHGGEKYLLKFLRHFPIVGIIEANPNNYIVYGIFSNLIFKILLSLVFIGA